jgi:DNA-binding NarL/FixJ family response regulator
MNVVNNVELIQQQLSSRELEVMKKLMAGLPLKKISNQLSISERTVKFHCANIYSKLKVKSRIELISVYSIY